MQLHDSGLCNAPSSPSPLVDKRIYTSAWWNFVVCLFSSPLCGEVEIRERISREQISGGDEGPSGTLPKSCFRDPSPALARVRGR